MNEFEFTSRIAGASYHTLLRELVVGADAFGFIIRPRVAVSDKANDLINSLTSDFLSDARKDRWPGTVLVGHDARVIELKPTETVLDKLLAVSDCFWDWMQPDLPEDLFIMKQGVAVLTTIAHEHFGLIRVELPTSTMSTLLRVGKMVKRKNKRRNFPQPRDI